MLRYHTLFFLFSASFSFSQTTINGIVKDQSDLLLLGNVVLLSPEDSSLIKGSYFDLGEFSIEHIISGEALLKISSYGFNDTIFVINGNESAVDLGIIYLEMTNTELEGVTVMAKIPLFESSEDGALKVNVQNTMLSSSTTVLEVLSKSPNVLVSESGVQIFGKGEALLYLDGTPITMQQLNAISVSSIKSIEIISNPTSRWDANGRAVINIRTILNRSEGLSGVLGEYFTLARNPLNSTTVKLNYKKNKWSLTADYGVHLGRDWNKLNATRELSTDFGVFTSTNDHLSENKMRYVSNYKLGAAYRFNEKSSINLEYRGSYGLIDLNKSVSNNLTDEFGDQSLLSTQNNGEDRSIENSAIGNYRLNLDTLGSELFIGGQYSLYNGNQRDEIVEKVTSGGAQVYAADRISDGNTKIEIVTSQVDYLKRFKNKSKFELGAKFARANNTGDIVFSSSPLNSGNYTVNAALSNGFEYVESIPAIYTQYASGFGKMFKYSFGLRSEYTLADGYSNVLMQKIIDTSYLNVFPSVVFSANISSTFAVGFGYSSRINRPKYQDLDPFVIYQDSLTSFQGNPFLKPELTDAFELNFDIQGFNFFKIGYNATKNGHREIVEPGLSGTNSIVLRKINVERIDSYFATLSIPYELKFWSSYNTISFSFDKISDSRPEFLEVKIYPGLYIYSYQKFHVKKWFDFELFGEFVGRQNDGIYATESTFSISAAVSRKFLNKKLTCRIVANDFLRSFRQAGSFAVGPTTVVYDQRLNTNFYRLTLTYNFGKLKNITYKSKETSKEELDRIK